VPVRLLYLVSHPIQYQAPLLRLIADDPDIEMLVLFESMANAGTFNDPGFGQNVTWDVPLTEGFAHAELNSAADVDTYLRAADALWVHGWDSALKRASLKAASKAGVPVLMRGENTNSAMPDGGLMRGMIKRMYLNSIFNLCAGFLCIGSENRQYYLDHGVEATRLFSMPYSVDNEFFQNRARDAHAGRVRFCRELGLETGRPVILFAGKLQARKHPLALLAAFRGLDMEMARHPYLLYVGDGDQRAALEEQSRDMGDRVRILGFKNQTELPAYYDLADVFVLASDREPWGLSVNEAMNANTAVVVSNECGCATDLVDPACGRVVRAGDVVALRGPLSDLLSDPAGLREMGQQAGRRIAGWGLRQSHEGLRQALIRLKLLSA